MKITKSLLERIKPVLKYCEYMDFLEDNKGDDPDFNREYWELKANLPKVLEVSLFNKMQGLFSLALLPPSDMPSIFGPYRTIPLREDRLLKELQETYYELGLNKSSSIEDYQDFIKLVKFGNDYYVVRQ